MSITRENTARVLVVSLFTFFTLLLVGSIPRANARLEESIIQQRETAESFQAQMPESERRIYHKISERDALWLIQINAVQSIH